MSFFRDFSTDDACLDKVFALRCKDSVCSKCNQKVNFKRIEGRQCFQCSKCSYHYYPCAGTIFHKSRTPLRDWFYIIYLFTVSKNGISAYEVQRHLKVVTYKTAWRMLKQIRTLLENDNIDFFTGTVELDETFVGGKNINRHADKKVPNSQGRSFKDKTPVFGIFHRESKKVRTFVTPNTSPKVIQPLIYKHITLGSNVMSDEWCAYQGLNQDYNHDFVNHRIKQYSNGDVTTNRIENFWSVFKRTIKGSYIQVSPKYLQMYANEVSFRFNNRNSETPIFQNLLGLLAA